MHLDSLHAADRSKAVTALLKKSVEFHWDSLEFWWNSTGIPVE